MAQSNQRAVYIFFEGPPGNTPAARACRVAFRNYFTLLGLKGRLPKLIPCGGRNRAFNQFCNAVKDPPTEKDILPVLLIDSEMAVKVTDLECPRNFFRRNGMQLPKDVTNEQLHLLVQCFETLLVTDRAAVEKILGGQGFRSKELPKHASLEQVAVDEILQCLADASGVKGKKYQKGRHSFAILAVLDPKKPEAVLKWVERFHRVLLEIC